MREHRQRAARHVHAVDGALVEMPGDDRVAGLVVRVLADPAWTEDAAVADFEQPSFEVISHESLLPGCRKEEDAAGTVPAGRGEIIVRALRPRFPSHATLRPSALGDPIAWPKTK